MKTGNRPMTFRSTRTLGAIALAAAGGTFALPLEAVEVERVTLNIQDSLGIPAIQAIIAACTGEEIFFTGTVQLILVDGVAAHVNWQGMTGKTADGDLFVATSSANLPRQSNVTLAEVGAGADARQVHIQTVNGALAVTCH